MGAIVGVLGGNGGVGASSFAAALAMAVGSAMLVDCDPVGGGVDVLLGIESVPGARWSGLRLDGGRLDPALLAEGVPRWRSVGVLAADVAPAAASDVAQVVAAAAELGTVVLDLPRAPSPLRAAGLACCELCVLVAAAEVRALAGARAVRTDVDVPVGVVLRRGSVPVAEAIRTLGAPLLGVLPPLERAGTPRAVHRLAAGVAAGVISGVVPGAAA